MAVSNAFGSNTFNIFIALGFPWMVGTIIRPNCDEDPANPGVPAALQVRPAQVPVCTPVLAALAPYDPNGPTVVAFMVG